MDFTFTLGVYCLRSIYMVWSPSLSPWSYRCFSGKKKPITWSPVAVGNMNLPFFILSYFCACQQRSSELLILKLKTRKENKKGNYCLVPMSSPQLHGMVSSICIMKLQLEQKPVTSYSTIITNSYRLWPCARSIWSLKISHWRSFYC